MTPPLWQKDIQSKTQIADYVIYLDISDVTKYAFLKEYVLLMWGWIFNIKNHQDLFSSRAS